MGAFIAYILLILSAESIENPDARRFARNFLIIVEWIIVGPFILFLLYCVLNASHSLPSTETVDRVFYIIELVLVAGFVWFLVALFVGAVRRWPKRIFPKSRNL